jgi:hypothetical protein
VTRAFHSDENDQKMNINLSFVIELARRNNCSWEPSRLWRIVGIQNQMTLAKESEDF